VALGPSASLSVTGEAVTVRGSVARIGVEHNLEDQVITSITSIGRVASTWTETKCNHAILRMLQRSLAIFDNHWIKAIWCPSQPICWPEYFSPPPDDPATEISEHPDAPLNNSQSSAIAAMLSQSFNTCISLVQGPPGTGKTTVVATYVISAIKAGQRGIWLMAQSNFAVKAIAEKLAKLGFLSFKLLISRSFYSQW
jgi:primosomal protein N'